MRLVFLHITLVVKYWWKWAKKNRLGKVREREGREKEEGKG